MPIVATRCQAAGCTYLTRERYCPDHAGKMCAAVGCALAGHSCTDCPRGGAVVGAGGAR